MSKAINRLTTLSIRKLTEPGFYHDGSGLYLQVSRFGTKSWVLRYTVNKKTRDMGLGPFSDWTLAEARENARQWRQQVDKGLDPIETRATNRQVTSKALSNRKTFEECAIACHISKVSGWKNEKHKAQWINTLTTYAFPFIGKMNVADVGKKEVAAVLEPIWLTKLETADRLRQRIRTVLTWASSHDYYPNYDLKMWDELPNLVDTRPANKNKKHHASCEYKDAGALLQRLQSTSISEMLKLCFEFMVLTTVRSGEARGTLKSEIDVSTRIWKIPASRMKMGAAHDIPLSDRALEIVGLAIALNPDSELLFPNPSKGKMYSDQAFTKVVLNETLKVEYTAHGFRATFRTWAGHETNYPREICEHALAHNIASETENAYARTNYFEKRIPLMQDWADYLMRSSIEKFLKK